MDRTLSFLRRHLLVVFLVVFLVVVLVAVTAAVPLIGAPLLVAAAVAIGASWWWARRHGDDSPPGGLRPVAFGAAAFVAVLLLIQVVPYGRDHTNPPVTAEPAWDSPRTRELAVRACFDCHSNETEWPWYTNVAPMSWAVANHAEEGRRVLNFSEWDRGQGRAVDEAAETVREGSMPTWDYRLIHSDARLTAAEKEELAAGLQRTLGGG